MLATEDGGLRAPDVTPVGRHSRYVAEAASLPIERARNGRGEIEAAVCAVGVNKGGLRGLRGLLPLRPNYGTCKLLHLPDLL